MQTNVGGADQVIRVIIGVALLLSMLWIEGNLRWIGLIGLIPLLTGLACWCPLYTLLGIKTCPREANHV